MLLAYAMPLSTVAATVVAAVWLGPAVKHTHTLFFCSIVLSSWFGGIWAGILATILSAIALDYFFVPPIYALGIGLQEAPDMIAFVASALFVSWLSAENKLSKTSRRQARYRLDGRVRASGPGLRKPANRSDTETSLPTTAGANPDALSAESVGAKTGSTIDRLACPSTPDLGKAGEEMSYGLKHETHAPDYIDGSLEAIEGSLLPHSTAPSRESLFFREGDYWTVQYQGQTARFKATRGFRCLALLLAHPSREFHVSELMASVSDLPVSAGRARKDPAENEDQEWTVRLQDTGPLLDAHAKVEYGRRLADLREELEDAERLNDPDRAARARHERDCIAEQLAAAVGLGGRDRKTGLQAERARSAVTKRIKDSVRKIAEFMPPLGCHLSATIRTGYFCSYNGNASPETVEWKVRL